MDLKRLARNPTALLSYLGGVLTDTTKPWGAAESVVYDFVIAPATAEMGEQAAGRHLEGLPEEADLLDVGCGGGQLLVALAELRPDLQVTGLDLSPQQVAAARCRSRHLGARCRVVEGSVLKMPFPDGSFDAVVSVASLKHWPDQLAGLRECIRVLRPGGTLLVAEADRGCRHEDAEAFVNRWRMPWVFRPLALQVFRTYVAGKALDLDDARSLLAEVPLADKAVGRVDGTPALVIRGTVHD